MSEPARGLDDEPHDDRPVYGERRRRALRIAVLVALGALVLPLMLSAYGVARSAADRACAILRVGRRARWVYAVSGTASTRVVGVPKR